MGERKQDIQNKNKEEHQMGKHTQHPASLSRGWHTAQVTGTPYRLQEFLS